MLPFDFRMQLSYVDDIYQGLESSAILHVGVGCE
jgi:hypothetical protein